MNKPLRKVLLISAGTIILFIILLLSFRNILLNNAMEKKVRQFSRKLGAEIIFSDAAFQGLSTIKISNFGILPPGNDTLVCVKQISIRIRPLELLRFRVRFADARISQPSVYLYRNGNVSNYLFLLDRKSPDSTLNKSAPQTSVNYAERVANLFNAFFNYVPSTVSIERFTVRAAINHHRFSFSFPELNISNNHFKTMVDVTDDSLSMHWELAGILNPRMKDAAISIKTADSQKVQIPYIHQRWKTIVAFDSVSARLSFTTPDLENSRLEGRAVVYGSLLNNERISPNDVRLDKSEVDYRLNFGTTFIELDSTSLFSFNKVGFNPYVRYDRQPEKKFNIIIHKPEFEAQDFFSSLPAGLFPNLEGIQVRGKLGFNLDFMVDFAQPDSLLFNSALTSHKFAVEHYGNTNFGFINEPFLYTAYEKGQAVRQFMVGPENPEFRTIDQIPASLKNAIMTSEDGSFYFHNGFIPDAIRSSIITNIKEKRFARGGSTISMQLVKNVFLNRNKNITRKVEEMLITWLIENQRLVSKDRMFEVYLNVIETGPMVYGVNEAAQFYFKKDVSKLTLAESIYIASIVPRPKWFRYSFDENGALREYLQSYYSLVSGKMLRKEWISQEEFDNLKPEVELKGPARDLVLPADSIPAEEEIEPDLL
ncbi:MAG: transglycosylase domain-containing protein [Lentimicrobium sp.]